ncbi:MAG: hypothetical protein HYS17_04925 [Micavibrio aeruginosavorus]|uniref:Uncharacterized protein n=1 Tax=Micavibrio aeruginosavorus TaxID=349221 RepID=A0A7T5R3X6_9BACT|nr:MAG: hypothetical protein HYS17_04925 [Micavibrio aeruginosavorus]
MPHQYIPPHMIPPAKDKFREVQIPLHDYVDDRPPPPGWNRDGTRTDNTPAERPYNPNVPRWDM